MGGGRGGRVGGGRVVGVGGGRSVSTFAPPEMCPQTD